MFIGRNSEINVLNEYMSRPGNQIMVMYGQKGVGKTSIIREFSKKRKKATLFTASSVYERDQLYLWSRMLKENHINVADYPDFSDIFQIVDEKIAGDNDEKTLLVFDEFHHLLKHSNHFAESLFAFLEQSEKEYFIILCSSSIEWIENSMVKKLGAKAKNITGFFKVKELEFKDFTKYFSDFSFEDCVNGYAIFGGIPYIWEMLEPKRSLEDNIIQCVLNKNHTLYNYGEEEVSSSLREPGIYNTILCALAEGRNKLNDLYTHTLFSRAKISVYIKNLMELGIVEKEFSLDTDGRSNTQKGVYDICNHYVDFTYQFLFPFRYEIEYEKAEQFYKKRIKPYLKQYSSKYYSMICREFFELENQMRNLPIYCSKIEKWIGKAGTIDFVAQDEAGHTILALCNWERPMMRYDDYEWLLYCAKQARLKPNYVHLFSAGSFDEKLKFAENSKKNVKLVKLENM